MDIFGVLTMIGGLALFLYGMNPDLDITRPQGVGLAVC